MEPLTFIIVYLVGAFIIYIAHYYYIAYVYSKSKKIQQNYSFKEYVNESSIPRCIMSCFWLFFVLLAPIGLAVYYLVKLIQNAIKKHFNIKL